MQSCNGKRRLTINDKKVILKKVSEMQKEGKITVKSMSKSLNLPRSTLITIMSCQKEIEAAPDSENNRFRSKNQKKATGSKAHYSRIEEALYLWISSKKKDEGKILVGSQVRNKALMLAKDFGYSKFTASNGWCDRFKKKYKLEYKVKPSICNHPLYVEEKYKDVAAEDFLEIAMKEKSELNEPQSVGEQYSAIAKYLSIWMSKVEEIKEKITVNLLKDMAFALAGALGVESFTCSNGWMDKFQKRRAQQKFNSCEECNPKR